MKNYLMVPVRLDALYIEGEELAVVEQAANFSILPYFETSFMEEYNCETTNISESIVSLPYQNKTKQLSHGVHLHWAMPDALTRGSSGLLFPDVPNRWLVTRKRKEAETDTWNIDKQWVVESDFLYPPHLNKKGIAVSIPFGSEAWVKTGTPGEYHYQPPTQAQYQEYLAKDEQGRRSERLKRSAQPYRYMGRRMPLSAWQEDFGAVEYHPSLTAIGYGEPSFAAFYPNCFSVFGFHDQQPGAPLTSLKYEVTGWYSDEANDFVAKFMKDNKSNDPDQIKTDM